MENKQGLFIIIVTYNGMPWLKQCLDSCTAYPVLIVDNASTDDSVNYVESNYPEIIVLKQPDNLGFGQANNIGIRYALDHGAEHVFLLNQDAYLVGSVLDELVTFQQLHATYGILSPIHITGDRKKLDKNFSNFMLKEKTGYFYSDFVLGHSIRDVYDVPFVNAAAWLISRSCLETVGGFDPLFFHYGEDDNYCQRVVYHGFEIGILPKVYVIHDREDRIQEASQMFSDRYYKNVEKKYKAICANINVDNPIDLTITKLKKTILKLQLQLKHKRAADYKKELKILLGIRPMIEKSRRLNKKKGAHYI